MIASLILPCGAHDGRFTNGVQTSAADIMKYAPTP